MTKNELPRRPLDPRFSWARDLSTGRLHIASGGACYCNRRFRVAPVDSPDAASEVCPTCAAAATFTPPSWA